jgi:hypothetical protein
MCEPGGHLAQASAGVSCPRRICLALQHISARGIAPFFHCGLLSELAFLPEDGAPGQLNAWIGKM